MSEHVKSKSTYKRYDEEFKRQAVEMIIHGGRSLTQVARELGVSEYSLHLWKKARLGQMAPAQVDGREMSAQEMAREIRRLHGEVDYFKRQRDILKKAMSILGEEPRPGMR
jgi:transposase